MQFLGILNVEKKNSMYFWDDNTLSSGQQPAEDC